MGMPCTVNSILKLSAAQGFPAELQPGVLYTAHKDGYRILPMDVPVQLVDEQWQAQGEVRIRQLVWEKQTTTLQFELAKRYPQPLDLQG